MTRRRLLSSLILAAGSPLLPSVVFPIEASSTPRDRIPDDVCSAGTVFWSCWIGHSTVLMRVGTKWILTDPVLFDGYGISVFGTILGPHRIHKPALSIENIPKPDLILLSHAHLDHMDRTTLSALANRYPNQIDVITAFNTADVINDLRWNSLNELDWGNSISTNGINVEAVRVKHNGWRWPGESCRATGQIKNGRSYNGYHIDAHGLRIMFGGDTAYTEEFKRYRNRVDVALIPIGAYGGYHDMHCTPEEAVEMVRMMKARHIIPIHHATFRQSSEPTTEPLMRLEAAIIKGQEPLVATRYVGDTLALT